MKERKAVSRTMSKAPFFICPPRTRSTVLFQLMVFYAIHKFGLKVVPHGSFELFLEFNPNIHFTDIRTKETQLGEIHPVFNGDGLDIHYMSPARYTNTAERNLYKLSVLSEAKSAGHEYHIKGTYHVVDTVNEILDFFSDRQIVITQRRDIEQYALSYIYASNSNLYNAYNTVLFDNEDQYMDTIKKGIVAQNFDITDLLNKTKRVYELEPLLQKRNMDYTIAYYEDMSDYNQLFDIITSIYGTTEWQEYLPEDFENYIPTKVEKDYSKCILNYNDIIENVRQQIKESGLG